MNAPGWGFNLIVIAGAVFLFGGIALVLGILYWASLRGSHAANDNRGEPQSLPTTPVDASHPGAFQTQGIPRTQSRNWQGIPPGERGASFFSGRPARVSDLRPATVSVGGRSRRVLVDEDDWAILQAGMLPPMLMFLDMGHYVPWYAYSGYSPYMDYGDGMLQGEYVPYEQAAPEYWDAEPPIAEYAYTPEQEQYHDYAANEVLGAMEGQPSVAFEDVYEPTLHGDGSYDPNAAPAWAGDAVDPLGDPADSWSDPLGDPADSSDTSYSEPADFGSSDPLGDPADSYDAS
jgi:hypothetical protein